jgi:hypothetical protein
VHARARRGVAAPGRRDVESSGSGEERALPVDPALPRIILVVHGVLLSTDAEQNRHESIGRLVSDRLHGAPVAFEPEMYRYENINDAAQAKLRALLELVATRLVARAALGGAIDLVGDVVISLANGSTAAVIRGGLRERLEEIHDAGHPLYLVAHSLGSVYALDVINELIRRPEYFDRSTRRSWPVQGLVTFGSPLGLPLFRRRRLRALGAGTKFLRWINYWDRTDPIVSGSFYGKPNQRYVIAERFSATSPDSGWFVQDRVVDIGGAWLAAHVGYWEHPSIGDDLATLITS